MEELRGREPGPDRDSYFEALSFNLSRNWAPLTGLYRGSLKLIQLPIPELYDLEADPRESENLARRGQMTTHRCEARSRARCNESGERRPRSPAKRDLDSETAARLKTLGYLVGDSGGAPSSSEYGAEDDPKRLAPLADKLDEATNSRIAGDPKKPSGSTARFCRSARGFTRASILLAHVLEGTGRVEEAIDVLQRPLTAGQHEAPLFGMLGWCLEKAGRPREKR